jgi:GH24 family phage-related lysozyme (muramidase)
MSAAADITAARIIRDNIEGFKADVYDDATGEPIQCIGQPTVAYGFRVRQVSKWLGQKILALQLTECEAPLLLTDWYNGTDDVRRSALLEIAMNQGDSGLENGYPMLIAAVRAKDWPRSQIECTVENQNVKARYVRIGQILLTGVDA